MELNEVDAILFGQAKKLIVPVINLCSDDLTAEVGSCLKSIIFYCEPTFFVNLLQGLVQKLNDRETIHAQLIEDSETGITSQFRIHVQAKSIN